MFCRILKKLFSYIFLFVSIICKSGVYACVSSMPVKCAGGLSGHKIQRQKIAQIIAPNSIAEAVKKAIDM